MQPLDEYCLSQYRPLPVKARSDSGFLDIEVFEELYPSFDDVSNLYLAWILRLFPLDDIG